MDKEREQLVEELYAKIEQVQSRMTRTLERIKSTPTTIK